MTMIKTCAILKNFDISSEHGINNFPLIWNYVVAKAAQL